MAGTARNPRAAKICGSRILFCPPLQNAQKNAVRMTTPAVGSDNRTALSLYGIVYNTIYSIRRGGARAKILQKLSRRYAEKTAKNLDFTAVFVILYDFSVFQQNTIYCIYRKKINTISCLNLLTYTGRSAIMKLDPLKKR